MEREQVNRTVAFRINSNFLQFVFVLGATLPVRSHAQGLTDMNRILIAAILFFGLSPMAPAVAAQDDTWRIRQSAGDVNVTTGADLRVAAEPRLALSEGSVIVTGANARAVLGRGQEQIVLQGSSRVVLVRASNGSTSVQQSAGTAQYSIRKQAAPHFQVDTPSLSAVVKGTIFSVTVNAARSDVSVTEGAVEVATHSGNAVTLVRPGMSASVSAAATREIALRERNGTNRLVTGNEGGWNSGNALLRTGTSAAPAATRTNLSGLRDNTIGIEVASTHDHEALRLNGEDTGVIETTTAAGSAGRLRQAASDDLFGPGASSKRPRLRGMGNFAQDAANAVAGKVDTTMRTISRKKPLKITATVPWSEMYMGLFALMGLLVMSHIRTLRIRTRKLEAIT